MEIKQRQKESIIHRLRFKLFRTSKSAYHFFKTNPLNEQTILFIIGCQRSGTSITAEVFELDWNSKVYGEFSELSSEDPIGRIRFNPFDKVKAVIEKNKVPLIISKPLVETQNVLKLLDYYGKSKGLWMFRHYRDVVSSNLKKFGIRNGINNLRPIVDNTPNNWRSEHVPDDVRNIVLKYFSEDMLPNDAAAIFWFVRNQWFFKLELVNNPRIMMCRYDDMVNHPSLTFKNIYKFAGQQYPGDRIVKDIDSSSRGKGRKVELSPEIDKLCDGLLCRMNDVYSKR